jgi:hypothetical protein
MAVIPQPNSPAVSKSGAGPTISGDAMAAPGRALQQVGGAISQVGSDIRQLQIKIEKELYKKQQDIRNHELDLSAKAVAETMNDAYANAQPSEFQDIFDAVWQGHTEKFQSVVENMKSEDRAQYEAMFELDQSALQAHTNLLRTRKIIDNQTATAMDMFKLNIGDPTMQAQVKIDQAEAILKENLGPENAILKIAELKSSAYYDGLRQEYQDAKQLDDVLEIDQIFENRKSEMYMGHQTATRNEAIQAINRITSEKDRMIVSLTRMAKSGEALPVDEIEAQVGKTISREDADEIYKLSSNKQYSIEQKAALDVYKRETFSAVEYILEAEIFSKLNAANPAFTIELLKTAEKIIDDYTTMPAARAYSKQQLHARFRAATQEEDVVWWKEFANTYLGRKWGISDHMGDSMTTLPDNVRDKARLQYGMMLDVVSLVMEQTQSDFNLAELYTNLEEKLVSMHHNAVQSGTPITDEQIKEMAKYAMDTVSGKIVERTLQNQANTQAVQSQRQQAIEWLKANPNHPQAGAVRQKLGTVDLFE